ncbi:hypothetical protein EYF80_025922 [Liparis tanakae]|uniref:Uncharacterized protein n=1 Tax=Liparis tanakae TaxID=230148 RepID=A0A4Z2HFW2_9TELE|nr:hypothetical protein EYF80_025922 [Liparis tanakae]
MAIRRERRDGSSDEEEDVYETEEGERNRKQKAKDYMRKKKRVGETKPGLCGNMQRQCETLKQLPPLMQGTFQMTGGREKKGRKGMMGGGG